MLSGQHPSFSLSLRESQGLLNRAACMDAGDSWGGLIKTPFYSSGGVSLSLHTLTPTIPPSPRIHVCLTGLWGNTTPGQTGPRVREGTTSLPLKLLSASLPCSGAHWVSPFHDIK